MDDSMTHPFGASRSLDLPAWKTIISHLAALAVGLYFISSGVWKVIDPFAWQMRVEKLNVPPGFSMAVTLGIGALEIFSGVLIILPRCRRWGAWLTSGLLVIFMGYMGLNFKSLAGQDCSCSPFLQQTVGPMFFLRDGVFLLLSIVALWWARPSSGKRSAAVILGVVAVFSAVSYGIDASRQTGVRAPDTITVDKRPVSLQQGRFFLYFYNPLCSHCFDAAKAMSQYKWGDTKVIGLAVQDPQYIESFLKDSNLKALSSPDWEPLKKVFPFGDPPYGVVIENGRAKGMVAHFEGKEPAETLKKLGAIE